MISTIENGRKSTGFIANYWHTHTGVRLAAYLFLVIFIAQAVWIYPAYQLFKKDELNRLSQLGLAVMESVLTLSSADITPEDIKILGGSLTHNTSLKGARVYTYAGELFTEFGESPMYEPYELRQEWSNWLSSPLQDNRIEMAWLPQDSFFPYLIVGRMDSSHVQVALDNFLAFLLKMVFSVTFVSTFLLLWILHQPNFRLWLEKVSGVDHIAPTKKLR